MKIILIDICVILYFKDLNYIVFKNYNFYLRYNFEI